MHRSFRSAIPAGSMPALALAMLMIAPSLATAEAIKGDAQAVAIVVEQTWAADQAVRYFAPDDPYFNYDSPSGSSGQWHLDNQAPGSGPDVNILGAWARNVTGAGVTIGIADDSLQISHPDLAPNYVAADSWDFGQDDNDPSPVWAGDQHGVSVAGVAAAAGGNTIGVTGASPEANLAGLRIDFDNQTTQMFVDATLYHSSATNTNIDIKNHSYGIAVPYIDNSDQLNALNTSANAGTIHAWAAGNERSVHSFYMDVNGNGSFDPDLDYAADADANKKHTQSAIDSLAIAALDVNGGFSYYSNWGANVFVTAPSNGVTDYGILTTDRTGNSGYNAAGPADGDDFADTDYTAEFGGTSSATPLVSGILALGKQANANLDLRMAKHLLATTSVLVDAADATDMGGWTTNAAGLSFNPNYGFGLIDANAFTHAASTHTGVTALTTESTGLIAPSLAIPDGDLNGVSINFNLTGTQPLEDMELYLDVTHTWRGDVEALLTSPLGTTSRLMYRNGTDSFNNLDWTYATNAFWGETPTGTWTLTPPYIKICY